MAIKNRSCLAVLFTSMIVISNLLSGCVSISANFDEAFSAAQRAEISAIIALQAQEASEIATEQAEATLEQAEIAAQRAEEAAAKAESMAKKAEKVFVKNINN